MSSLVLIDPLTLVGKELLEILPRLPSLATSVRSFHTDSDDEYQIADFGGEPALVPPLTSPEELAGADLIVTAAASPGPRFEHLLQHLSHEPETALVDLGRAPLLRDLTVPACPGMDREERGRRLRVPHPAVTVAGVLCGPLLPLGLVSLSLTALEPVSELGSDAVTVLAAQAVARLQGLDPEELIGDRVRAFTLHLSGDEHLREDASAVLPGVDVLASRILAGCFHGHLVQLTLGIEPPPALGLLEELWLGTGQVELAGAPLSIEQAAGHDTLLLDPAIAVSGRGAVSVTAAADGLRVGGATTAVGLMIELLRL